MIDFGFDGALAVTALIGAMTYRARLNRIFDHEKLVIEHDQIMKYGRPETPKERVIEKLVSERVINVYCVLCNDAFQTAAWNTPICVNCRERIFTDGLLRPFEWEPKAPPAPPTPTLPGAQ